MSGFGWHGGDRHVRSFYAIDKQAKPSRLTRAGLLATLGFVLAGPGVVLANNPPVLQDLSVITEQDRPVRLNLSGSDDGGPGPYSCSHSQPGNGQVVRFNLLKYGYTPDPLFVGTDIVTFTCSDGELTSNVATATIVVNDKPVATGQTILTLLDEAAEFPVDVVDVVTPGPPGITITSPPTSGSLSEPAPGQLRYQPTSGFLGADFFGWQYCDGHLCSNSVVTRVDVNDVPVANDQPVATNQDATVVIALDVTDDYTPGPWDIQIELPPSNGSLTVFGPMNIGYTPATGHFGTDQFRYRWCDGLHCSGPATVDILTNAVPIANDQDEDTFLNTPLGLTLDYHDPDGLPSPAVVSIQSNPQSGTLESEGAANEYLYTPNTDFSGLDFFTYNVSDGMAESRTAIVRVRVGNLPEIDLHPEILNLAASTPDQPLQTTRTITVTNSGGSTLEWSAAALPGPTTIAVSPASGSLASGESAQLFVQIDVASLGPGAYDQVVRFTAPDAVTSPVDLPVFLRLRAPGDLPLGIAFPDVPGDDSGEVTGGHLRDLGVQFVRQSIQWSVLEQEQGVFSWSSLDSKILLASQRDLGLLLTVTADCPDWVSGPRSAAGACVPDDMDHFTSYIAALVAHLAELEALLPEGLPLDFLQFGNEWDSPNSVFYPGSAAQFVQQLGIVFDAVKATFPGLPIVLGGIQTTTPLAHAVCAGLHSEPQWPPAAVASYCANDFPNDPTRQRVEFVLQNGSYDAVDQHLYFREYRWAPVLTAFRQILLPPAKAGIPILVTEFGGPNALTEPRDDAYHAQKVEAYIGVLQGSEAARAYYFKLVEPDEIGPNGRPDSHAESGLIDKSTLLPKPGYFVFQQHTNPD